MILSSSQIIVHHCYRFLDKDGKQSEMTSSRESRNDNQLPIKNGAAYIFANLFPGRLDHRIALFRTISHLNRIGRQNLGTQSGAFVTHSESVTRQRANCPEQLKWIAKSTRSTSHKRFRVSE